MPEKRSRASAPAMWASEASRVIADGREREVRCSLGSSNSEAK
jgi:hypothetical protein